MRRTPANTLPTLIPALAPVERPVGDVVGTVGVVAMGNNCVGVELDVVIEVGTDAKAKVLVEMAVLELPIGKIKNPGLKIYDAFSDESFRAIKLNLLYALP